MKMSIAGITSDPKEYPPAPAQEMAEGVENADAAALLDALMLVKTKKLFTSEIVMLWESVIKGTLKGNIIPEDEIAKEFYEALEEASQDPVIREVYQRLQSAALYPHPMVIIFAGAALVDVKEGKIDVPGFDRERYLALAKECFLNIKRYGNEDAKKIAIEALRNLGDDPEVKEELVKVAKTSKVIKLKEAAEDSLRHIRQQGEIEAIHSAWRNLKDYARTEWAKQVLVAAETVLTKNGDGMEAAVATKQLVTLWAVDKLGWKDTLYAEEAELLGKNVENALIHAFVNGNESVRQEAGLGLVKIRSERIMDILVKISKRECDENGVFTEKGGRVRALLLVMHKRMHGTSLPPPPPSAKKRKQARSRALPPPRSKQKPLFH